MVLLEKIAYTQRKQQRKTTMFRFSPWHKQVTEVLKERKTYFYSKCTIRFQLLHELF